MRRVLVVVAALAVLAAACSDDPAAETTVPPTTTTTTFGGTTSTVTTSTSGELRPQGGTVRYFREFVGGLNPFLQLGGDTQGAMFNLLKDLTLSGVWRFNGLTGDLEPDLVVDLPTHANGGLMVNGDGSLTVRYEIDPDAVWADGVPVTGEDFAFTYGIALEVAVRLATEEPALGVCGFDLPVQRFFGHAAYDEIIPASVSFGPDYFEYTLVSGGVFSSWLFDIVVPRHVVEGTDILVDWTDRMWPSAGPFVFASWDRQAGIAEFVRNDRYWRSDPETGQQLPHLDRVIVDSLVDERIERVTEPVLVDDDGDPGTEPVEVDGVIEFGRAAADCLSPDQAAESLGLDPAGDAAVRLSAAWGQASKDALASLYRDGTVIDLIPSPSRLPDGIDFETVRGSIWEFIAFHFSDARLRENPDSLVEHLEFRRAVAHAIDRDLIAATVFGVPAPRVDSVLGVFSPSLGDPGWRRYPHDPDTSRALLAELCGRLGRDSAADPPKVVFTRDPSAAHRVELTNLLIVMLEEVGIDVEVVDRGLGATFFFDACTGYEFSTVGFPIEGSEVVPFFRDVFAPGPDTFWAWGNAVDESMVDDLATPDCDESAPGSASSVRNEFSVRFSELVDETRSIEVLSSALPFLLEMDDILASEVVVIPLYMRPAFYAVNDDVLGGYGYAIDGDRQLWNVDRWYLKQPQPGT